MSEEIIVNTISSILKLIAQLSDICLSYKREHQLKEKILKDIIFHQRQLETVTKGGNYDSELIHSHERDISNYLKTYFDDEFELAFSSNLTEINFALRWNQEISNLVIENSLIKFISYCNHRKYRVN